MATGWVGGWVECARAFFEKRRNAKAKPPQAFPLALFGGCPTPTSEGPQPPAADPADMVDDTPAMSTPAKVPPGVFLFLSGRDVVPWPGRPKPQTLPTSINKFGFPSSRVLFWGIFPETSSGYLFFGRISTASPALQAIGGGGGLNVWGVLFLLNH